MKILQKLIIIVSVCSLLISGLEAASLKVLSKRIDKYRDLAKLHLQRAQIHINNEHYKEASFDLNRAILIDPKLEQAQLFLAEILIEENQEDEAIKLLENVLKISKNDATHVEVYQRLGDVYMKKTEVKLALVMYKKMFNKNVANNEESYMKMADAYYELGEFKKSIKVLKDGLNVMIDKDMLQEKIVDISMQEGHYTLALSVLNNMISEDETKARLYYKRAQIFKEQGKVNEMNLEIKKAKISLLKHEKNSLYTKKLHIELKSLYASL